MAATLYAWPGTSAGFANAYCAVSDGDTYFASRLGADAWTDASTDEKKQALVSATRMIDRQRWAGTSTSGTFPYSTLAWPRSGVTDKYGDSVSATGLPADIITGTEELALALLEDESAQDTASAGTNTKRVKAGQVEVEFFKPTLGQLGRFPLIVQELLGQFLAGANSSSAGVVSGDDRQSYFDVIVSDDPDVAVDNTFSPLDVFP